MPEREEGEIQPARPAFDGYGLFSSPVTIASIELWRIERKGKGVYNPFSGGESLYFIRSTSTDGATGIAVAHERITHLHPILQELVIPFFVGKDARDLERLIDGVYVYRSNYKLAGLALWCCVGWVEQSLLDLLGRAADKSVGGLLGGVLRRRVPVYLSSLRRDRSPEDEVAFMEHRIAETGARAAKFKIGGRMSGNSDAGAGRTERLVKLARRQLGDDVAIYADANGSYNSAKAVEVGKMLEEHGLAFFEEPCPFDDMESTRAVADALSMPVAGGEQETSLARFELMMKERVVDILQPDLNYNGGSIRTMRVARAAQSAGVPLSIHNARLGAHTISTLHFVSALPSLDRLLEYNAAPASRADRLVWPGLTVDKGALTVPEGPGLGISIDPAGLRRAKRFGGLRRSLLMKVPRWRGLR
jgi:L-alanine-DL-glutamate epimerase-like enolase superfamily enzyme